jgi:hypothetical protein
MRRIEGWLRRNYHASVNMVKLTDRKEEDLALKVLPVLEEFSTYEEQEDDLSISGSGEFYLTKAELGRPYMETPMFAKYMENITVAKDPTYSPTAQPPASDPSGSIKSRPRSKSTTKHGPIKVDYVTAGYVKKIANFMVLMMKLK